jgi:hypothetical protein
MAGGNLTGLARMFGPGAGDWMTSSADVETMRRRFGEHPSIELDCDLLTGN